MKKLFKSFYLTIFVYLGILSIFLITDVFSRDFGKVQLLGSYIPPFAFFYLPIFITFFFYENNTKLKIIKSTLISFIIAYIFTYFIFEYITHQKQISFLNSNIFSLAIVGFFTSLFLNLILIFKEKFKINRFVNRDIKYSHKIVILIPLLVGLIYSIIILMNPSNSITVWGSFIPLGIITSFSSVEFFNFVYKKKKVSSRVFYIIFYYFIATLIFLGIYVSSVIFSLYKIDSQGFLFFYIKESLYLYGPFFCIIILLTHFYYLKLVTKEQKNQLTQQSLESQLNYQQLKNQLSPHFLFNNINVLTSLIEENQKKAVRFSENLSDIYRYFLEQEKQDVVLVKDEIAFAKSYLELFKDRFEIGLNFTISIDKKSEEKYIVSTILQQVLENVIKHNTINELNIVNIEITSIENYLIIENNKNKKLETILNSKKGIENIKKRIAFFTDEKVIIESTEKNFIIKLPILETV